jgi:hypothetical protein
VRKSSPWRSSTLDAGGHENWVSGRFRPIRHIACGLKSCTAMVAVWIAALVIPAAATNEAFRSLGDFGRSIALLTRTFCKMVLERGEAHHGLASHSVDRGAAAGRQ